MLRFLRPETGRWAVFVASFLLVAVRGFTHCGRIAPSGDAPGRAVLFVVLVSLEKGGVSND